ncbi:MAG TPA: hypothetical protein VG711_03240, partial [Phycisphaerales bacterium]|nr:hypothetical protein [Phycisphaerales bacterium]
MRDADAAAEEAREGEEEIEDDGIEEGVEEEVGEERAEGKKSLTPDLCSQNICRNWYSVFCHDILLISTKCRWNMENILTPECSRAQRNQRPSRLEICNCPLVHEMHELRWIKRLGRRIGNLKEWRVQILQFRFSPCRNVIGF